MCRNWVSCENVNRFVSLSDLAHLSNPDRVGVHQPSCVILMPSPAASPMPRLAAHCLHTSIKSSIFFCSTPVLLSTHLSCFAPPQPFLCLRVCAPVMSRPLRLIHPHSTCLAADMLQTECLTKPRLPTTSFIGVKP